MKSVVLTGIDSTGKSTQAKNIVSSFKNVFLRKYPHDEELRKHINEYYNRLINSGKELHEEAILNMYRQVHDMYDRDFRLPLTVPSGTELILFDRYFIDNIVHSRMNYVEKQFYGENHFVVPDLVILLKAKNYNEYKKTFKLKGDENIREPVILFHEVQPVFQDVLKELHDNGRIKRYTVVEALVKNTDHDIKEVIKNLLFFLIGFPRTYLSSSRKYVLGSSLRAPMSIVSPSILIRTSLVSNRILKSPKSINVISYSLTPLLYLLIPVS